MNDTLRFISVFVLFTLSASFIMFHKDIEVQLSRPFSEFPQQVATWKMSGYGKMGSDILGVLKATDYLSCSYFGPDGNRIALYIGYHGGGKKGGGIHSPKHCLPGEGWSYISARNGVVETATGPINLVQSIYQKGDDRMLFLYWFQVRNRTLSDEFSLKMAEIINSVRYRRGDSSFIRVSLPIDDDNFELTMARGEQFIRDIAPVLKSFLPQ